MIDPDFVTTMAAYNAVMNRSVYAAAGRLSDAARRSNEGAFWESVHGTLSHLLWSDHMWMSRLSDWPPPEVKLAQSGGYVATFEALTEARVQTDARLTAWARDLAPEWLGGTLTWFSGATQREQIRPRDLVVTHLFNHQTHHRGQVHALLTRLGEVPGVTDLPFVLP